MRLPLSIQSFTGIEQLESLEKQNHQQKKIRIIKISIRDFGIGMKENQINEVINDLLFEK